MFDLHSHILPGIDDGAKTIEDSIEMARIAVNSGTTIMIATPHVIEGRGMPDWETIVSLCEELNNILKQENIALQILPGAEVALNIDTLVRMKELGSYCINGGRYMLVELPATHIPEYTDEFLFTLQARGIAPILAHPERHPELATEPRRILDWVSKGILMQLNGSSLMGKMGERTKKMAELLLTNNLIHCIGSDAHSPRTRTPRLTDTLERAISLIDSEITQQLLYINPQQIIASEEVAIPEVREIRMQKPGLFKRLFKMIK